MPSLVFAKSKYNKIECGEKDVDRLIQQYQSNDWTLVEINGSSVYAICKGCGKILCVNDDWVEELETGVCWCRDCYDE